MPQVLSVDNTGYLLLSVVVCSGHAYKLLYVPTLLVTICITEKPNISISWSIRDKVTICGLLNTRPIYRNFQYEHFGIVV